MQSLQGPTKHVSRIVADPASSVKGCARKISVTWHEWWQMAESSQLMIAAHRKRQKLLYAHPLVALTASLRTCPSSPHQAQALLASESTYRIGMGTTACYWGYIILHIKRRSAAHQICPFQFHLNAPLSFCFMQHGAMQKPRQIPNLWPSNMKRGLKGSSDAGDGQVHRNCHMVKMNVDAKPGCRCIGEASQSLQPDLYPCLREQNWTNAFHFEVAVVATAAELQKFRDKPSKRGPVFYSPVVGSSSVTFCTCLSLSACT